MKKFFAALLAISITAALAGCGDKPAEEQLIDDITEGNSVVTEASETVSETEADVSADIEAEDTALKETSETKTEIVTEKATDTKKRRETFSADAESLLGEWYAIDFIGMKNATVTFGEDGSFSLVRDDDYKVIGTYTVSDGLVEVIYNDGEDWKAYVALFDGDVLILKFIGWNYDYIKEKYRPYDSELSVGEYLDREGNDGIEYVLSKEKSKLAEQEDVLGAWYASKDGMEGVMLFKENSITDMSVGDISDLPLMLRNGVYTETGEMPKNISMTECSFYICGEKIYMIFDDDYFEYDEHTLVLERFQTAPLTADMLDGSVGRDNETYYYFKDGQFYVFTEIADMTGYDFKIDGDKIILPIDGKDVTFTYYIVGIDIYLVGENMNIALTLTE